jgi:hypothetical protein
MPQVRLLSELASGRWVRSLRRNGKIWLTLTFVTTMFCLTAVGCDNTKIISSTEASSVDGRWMATAQSVRHSGPGNNDVETQVYLTSTNTKKKVEILGFAHDPTLTSNSIDLKLVWQTPTLLQVTYTNHPKVYLQEREVGGVAISTEERLRP